MNNFHTWHLQKYWEPLHNHFVFKKKKSWGKEIKKKLVKNACLKITNAGRENKIKGQKDIHKMIMVS